MCAALYFCVCILCTAKHCVLSIIVQLICFTHFASPHNYYSVSYAFIFVRCVYLFCWCCLLFMFHLWVKLYDICLSQSDLFPLSMMPSRPVHVVAIGRISTFYSRVVFHIYMSISHLLFSGHPVLGTFCSCCCPQCFDKHTGAFIFLS